VARLRKLISPLIRILERFMILMLSGCVTTGLWLARIPRAWRLPLKLANDSEAQKGQARLARC
jgi:hypothetical protein